MLKGLLALFTTGLIFNPAILVGALSGILAYIFLDSEHLKMLYTNYHLYLLFLLICALYTYFARPTLKDNLIDTDFKATSKDAVKHFFLMSFSFIMGMLFASFFDFSDLPVKPQPTIYKNSEFSDLLDLQKQAKDMQKSYDMMLEAASKQGL